MTFLKHYFVNYYTYLIRKDEHYKSFNNKHDEHDLEHELDLRNFSKPNLSPSCVPSHIWLKSLPQHALIDPCNNPFGE